MTRRVVIGRPCVDCGRRTTRRSRCEACALKMEAARDATEWWREAYRSPEYHDAREITFARSGGRCERVVDGKRCLERAREANHIRPLSEARTMAEAIVLCDPSNLEATCSEHNPRGGWNREAVVRR